MKNRIIRNSIIIFLLTFGVLYKLLITSHGNFIFNIDNARDMVDVREMVVLHKPRLTGPTSGIEGLYDGPAWYYLLAIPFLLTGGNPYAEVLLMIFLWAIGGYFLLKTTSRFGNLPLLVAGTLWVASNYITLTTIYAFNPNPVVLLTPLAVYLLERYILKNTMVNSVLIWLLAGLFFNFEMAFGLFMPIIILAAVLMSGRVKEFFKKETVIGFGVFVATLLPQVVFNLRHQSILFQSVSNNLAGHSSAAKLNFFDKVGSIVSLYNMTTSATLMNWQNLEKLALALLLIAGVARILTKRGKISALTASVIAFIFVPFIGAIILPINIMPWHIGGPMAAIIILIAELVFYYQSFGKISRVFVAAFSVVLIFYAFNNLELSKNLDANRVNNDPSSFNNEIAAIDYAYKLTEGKDFKTYIYIPSVIDYPFQYLFWWYGKKSYGYIPKDYAYAPNKPQYISNKQFFLGDASRADSGLTILIMDLNRPDLEDLWKNSFTDLKTISSTLVGPFRVEARK